MQAILSAILEYRGPGYAIHPGDLAWWAFHSDPLTDDAMTYWLDGDRGFVVLDAHEQRNAAFCVPNQSPIPLLEWARGQLGPDAKFWYVSSDDEALVTDLKNAGYRDVGIDGPIFTRRLTADDTGHRPPAGFTLRALAGEEEADRRRQASHAAFKSKMDPDQHLDRYLRFMRSPVYDLERDLVAVAPDGTIASFMIWWPDASGIAQIEPMGTDPAFHRRGVGRALMEFACSRMREAGMTEVRVITDEHRQDAVAFYAAVGFTRVADLRFWMSPRRDLVREFA
jgi:ribosomal protein S18 acetylase RimI-like enzyme